MARTKHFKAAGGSAHQGSLLARVLGLVLLCCGGSAAAQSAAEFYQNHPLTLLVGSAPGGVTDTSARIIAGYLEAYVPGQPTVIVQNMPGGGSVTMANHLYRSAARDGSVLGYSLPAVVLAQLMEPNRAKYDGRELSWIGSAITAANSITVLDAAPATTVAGARETEIIIGATGRGSLLYQLPAIASELLDLQLRIITGYQGSAEIALAMERGEVHGQASGMDYWSLSRPDWLAEGRLSHLLYIGPEDERTAGAPHLGDLVSTPQDKALVALLEIGPNMGWPLFGPPDVPSDRLAALRQAFDDVMSDDDFSDDILAAMRAPLRPTTGAELAAIATSALDTPDTVVSEAKELLGL